MTLKELSKEVASERQGQIDNHFWQSGKSLLVCELNKSTHFCRESQIDLYKVPQKWLLY